MDRRLVRPGSVAFIICARYGVRAEHAFSGPQTWAGSDPRAQPAAAILTAGERVTTAAAKISRLLDHHLAGNRPGRTAGGRGSYDGKP